MIICTSLEPGNHEPTGLRVVTAYELSRLPREQCGFPVDHASHRDGVDDGAVHAAHPVTCGPRCTAYLNTTRPMAPVPNDRLTFVRSRVTCAGCRQCLAELR